MNKYQRFTLEWVWRCGPVDCLPTAHPPLFLPGTPIVLLTISARVCSWGRASHQQSAGNTGCGSGQQPLVASRVILHEKSFWRIWRDWWSGAARRSWCPRCSFHSQLATLRFTATPARICRQNVRLYAWSGCKPSHCPRNPHYRENLLPHAEMW